MPDVPTAAGDARAACRAIIAEHSKSFALASRLLPTAVRDDAVILYAWCRRCDDAIDETPPAGQPAALARLREELDAVYGRHVAGDVVLDAFAEVVRRRRLPRQYPEALLAGMETDVRTPRLADRDELLVYCHRVAGVVGLMMCHVLGVAGEHALPHAAHLGIAMQLTNIARDVREDWDRGRRYLPLEMFPAEVRSRVAEPAGPLPTDEAVVKAIRQVTGRLLAAADVAYASADAGLPLLDRRSGRAIRVARLVYSRIGHIVASRRCDPHAPRAYTGKARKMALVARAVAEGRFGAAAGSVRIPETVLEGPAAVKGVPLTR